MFSTVLVANRGEIAVRIMKTLTKLGIRSVAVYSDADASALHVRSADVAVSIGPAAARESYLNVEAIISAAKVSGAEAIHPGYGFLSESPALALACEAAGIIFIGPSPRAIEVMGDKISAKQTVSAAGVPTVPGRSEPGLSDADLIEAIGEIGFPALLKPSAGGGGKGMRLLESGDDVAQAIASARREASSSFGDDTLFVERYLPAARHLEVQVLADSFGNVVHFGERECSLQRRHQKIVEEAPSSVVDDALRSALGEQAVAVARSSGYVNAGTVEFIVSASDPSEFYFMEMNSRLQVEHPVTELVWGVDLVEQQLRIAAGEPLGFVQADLSPTGHAVEVRIYAEDPDAGFLPTGGDIFGLVEPTEEGIRIDSGIEAGDVVGSNYDPMLAKVISYGETRSEALNGLSRALGDYLVFGPTTNVAFLRRLLDLDDVKTGAIDTNFVEREIGSLSSSDPSTLALAAGALWALETSGQPNGPWDLSGWRLRGRGASRWTSRLRGDLRTVTLTSRGASSWGVQIDDGDAVDVEARWQGEELEVAAGGQSLRTVGIRRLRSLWVGGAGDVYRFDEPEPHAAGLDGEEAGGQITSPMPGQVISVNVTPGERVATGTVVAVVEAMKMEHALHAPSDGVVTSVLVRSGDQVALGQIMIELGEEDAV